MNVKILKIISKKWNNNLKIKDKIQQNFKTFFKRIKKNNLNDQKHYIKIPEVIRKIHLMIKKIPFNYYKDQ